MVEPNNASQPADEPKEAAPPAENTAGFFADLEAIRLTTDEMGDIGTREILTRVPVRGNRSHPPADQAAAFAGIVGRVRLARAAAMREQAYAQGSTPRLRQVSMTLRPAA